MGQDVPTAYETAKVKAQESRDAFVRTATGLLGSADAANRLADAMGMIPDQLPIPVSAPGSDAVIAALSEIRDQVNSDNEKDIVISDNSPEVIAALNDLGIKTTTLPDGSIKITDNASDVAAKIDRELQDKKTTGTHTIYTTEQIQQVRANTIGAGAAGPALMPDGTGRADGGIDIERYANGTSGRLPAQAEIKPAQPRLIQWAEPETGGEAFIPLSASKRPRSMSILEAVADHFGMALAPKPTPMAMGGFGGYTGAKASTGVTVPTSLSGWAGLSGSAKRAAAHQLTMTGAGAAFTMASVVDGNGGFAGVDTGASSPAIAERGLRELTQLAEAQLEETRALREAAEAEDPVHVQVDIDQGNRSADIEIMNRGLR